ncbi:TIGR02679 family protein [Streptomyces sp. KLMMK]|uniref:TIGR02679 family protein n=1 Tax=Streptomyces sp. KLMMK TaxID=3109353 RepID=UPI002FFD96C0
MNSSQPCGVDSGRLHSLLGAPELVWLVERVRRRLEREQPLTGPVSLAAPTEDQRAAVERLLGRPPRAGRTLSVRLDAVDAVLRRSGISPDGLAVAVTTLTGAVTPLSQVHRDESYAWREAYAPLEALGHDHPHFAAWVARLRTEGLVRRLARTPDVAQKLLADTARALRELPAAPALSLPAFSARVLGSAHALDDGTPLSTLTLSGIRALNGLANGSGAAWRRDVWASAGLLRDELSSTVLTLNLRGNTALDWMADAGEPCVLTLRQLTHRPPSPAPRQVRICENPAVLAAAADAHGADCPPLVCLQGQPSAAAHALLRHLHEGGARLLYHGDFDWGGLRIATVLLRSVPWRPWRYTATDYRAMVARTPSLPPLTGKPTEAPWDPALAPALNELGVRAEEETALDTLLADLA